MQLSDLGNFCIFSLWLHREFPALPHPHTGNWQRHLICVAILFSTMYFDCPRLFLNFQEKKKSLSDLKTQKIHNFTDLKTKNYMKKYPNLNVYRIWIGGIQAKKIYMKAISKKGKTQALYSYHLMKIPPIYWGILLPIYKGKMVSNCFTPSPRRPNVEYKRMVLELTHGLFIT